MHFIVSLLLLSALASRALAVFNISVNNVNLITPQILAVPNSAILTTCATNCTAANSTLQDCNDDVQCLCKNATVLLLRKCEQCMFNKLVETNQKPLDFRMGSQAVLSAYATACLKDINVTLTASLTALTTAPGWDGPVVAILPVGGVVVAVISAVILGGSTLFILSNM